MQVLSFNECARRAGITRRTLERQLAAAPSDGPEAKRGPGRPRTVPAASSPEA